MSSDKECLLVEEDYALPEDLNCHQESCNHRDQAYPSFEAEYGCDDRPDHPEAQTVSRLFSAYYFTLHLVCVLLAVSLFFTTTRHCGNHPDLAMLGTWGTSVTAHAASSLGQSQLLTLTQIMTTATQTGFLSRTSCNEKTPLTKSTLSSPACLTMPTPKPGTT